MILIAAGFVAGVMNAAAGGGTFVTLPALIFAGVPSVMANASSTVALYPGSLTSTWAYRKDLFDVGAVSLQALLAVSLAGGFVGAVLLLSTPQAAFDVVIPWLLLMATLAFVFGRQTRATLRRLTHFGVAPALVAQFVLGIYGGYFGGAVGIMMMAVWSSLGSTDLRAMNPAKTLLVAATNTVAVICFIAAGAVRWPETLAVLVAAAFGGYIGARTARRIDGRIIRGCIVTITAAMTIIFFVRAY